MKTEEVVVALTTESNVKSSGITPEPSESTVVNTYSTPGLRAGSPNDGLDSTIVASVLTPSSSIRVGMGSSVTALEVELCIVVGGFTVESSVVLSWTGMDAGVIEEV